MPLGVPQLISALADIISEAKWHFSIWEALQEARSTPEGAAVMNRYVAFFRPTILAHFETFIIASYQFGETRHDTVNFRRLKNALRDLEGRNLDHEQHLLELHNTLRPIWIKIGRLRNEAVGHITDAATQVVVFERAGLSAQEIEDFLRLAIGLHHGITYPRDQSIEAFNLDGKESTRRLIADLARLT